MYNNYVTDGYWKLNMDGLKDDRILNRFQQMRTGDRIALKSNMGKDNGGIKIKAIGIVTDINQTERRIAVNWILKDMDRVIPVNGCLARLHGPYEDVVNNKANPWVHYAFII
ncbi:MAG: hypothetical protein ACYC2U_07740 [Candidatus Amoebophilus sp.]